MVSDTELLQDLQNILNLGEALNATRLAAGVGLTAETSEGKHQHIDCSTSHVDNHMRGASWVWNRLAQTQLRLTTCWYFYRRLSNEKTPRYWFRVFFTKYSISNTTSVESFSVIWKLYISLALNTKRLNGNSFKPNSRLIRTRSA